MNLLMKAFTLLFLGCASMPSANEDAIVKTRASYDFNCDQSKIEVVKTGESAYRAAGCAKEGHYKIMCSLGPCQAVSK